MLVDASGRRSLADGLREPARELERDMRPRRFLTLLLRTGVGSPRMGAVDGIGLPGATAIVLRLAASGAPGWLYIQVARRTMAAPTMKVEVIG